MVGGKTLPRRLRGTGTILILGRIQRYSERRHEDPVSRTTRQSSRGRPKRPSMLVAISRSPASTRPRERPVERCPALLRAYRESLRDHLHLVECTRRRCKRSFSGSLNAMFAGSPRRALTGWCRGRPCASRPRPLLRWRRRPAVAVDGHAVCEGLDPTRPLSRVLGR